MAEEKHKKKWMQHAFDNAHGQFKAKAEHAGESTGAYAREHEHDSGKTGKQARLALVGMHAHHHAKPVSPSKMMKSMYHGKGE